MVDSLIHQLLPYVGCIFVTPGFRTLPGDIVGGATAALIDTGARRILVTCQHVLRALREQKSQNPAAILALNLGYGDQTVELPDPEQRRIDEQPSPLDLVSFHYTGLCSPQYPEKEYLRLDTANHANVEPGNYVVFVGFPGTFRKTDGCLLEIPHLAIPLVVTDVTEATIVAAADKDNREVLTDMSDNFGGFSGSPVYVLHPQQPPLLIGFVREWSSLAGGCLMISPSRYLGRDGTFAWRR